MRDLFFQIGIRNRDALLLDRRGSRLGFPVDVQSDLLVLREFMEGRYPASPEGHDCHGESDKGMG
jgi:hypothetical protein